MELVIRDLPTGRWPEAAAMAGRAFWAEDYNEPLGDDPFERYAIVHGLYRQMDPSGDGTEVLGAFVEDDVVGIAWVERLGSCWSCSMDPDAPPADGAQRVMQQVGLAIRTLHEGMPAHAYVGPIAVEPTLQRYGIGRRLVEAAWLRAAATAPPTVALDCDPRLRSFYESCCFTAVGVVTDPYGFEIVGLRRDPELAR